MSQSTVSEKRTVITSSSGSGFDSLEDIPYKANFATRTSNIMSRSSLPLRSSSGGSTVTRVVEYGYGSHMGGGMGPGGYSSVSSTGVNSVKSNREKEKKDLQDLNERFASYIEKVRFLEAQNRKLGAELDELRSKWGKETSQIKQMYEAELAEARRLIDDLSKDKAALEIKTSSMQEQFGDMQRQLDEAKKYRQTDREQIAKLNQQLADCESEINMLRRSIDSLETERSRDKATINRQQQEVDKLRIDLNNETLAHLDAENRRQTLEEEMEFMKKVHEQELKELAALAYRDTTAENREFWKSELGQAIRDIQQEYDAKVEQLRGDMEGFYNLKIQEYRTGATKQNMEVTHIREENKKISKQMSDMRGKLADLEARNAQLEKQYQDALREIEMKETDHMMETTQLRDEISKLRAEMEGILTELQTLMDAKLSLELEIAAYRKLLEGEENRVDWRSRASLIMYRDAFKPRTTDRTEPDITKEKEVEKPIEAKTEKAVSSLPEQQREQREASPDTDAASSITMSDNEMSTKGDDEGDLELGEHSPGDLALDTKMAESNNVSNDKVVGVDNNGDGTGSGVTIDDVKSPVIEHLVKVKEEVLKLETQSANDEIDSKVNGDLNTISPISQKESVEPCNESDAKEVLLSKPGNVEEQSPEKEEIVSVKTNTAESSLQQKSKSTTPSDSEKESLGTHEVDTVEDTKSKPESEKEPSPVKEEIVNVTTTTVEASVKQESTSPTHSDSAKTSEDIPKTDIVEDAKSKPESEEHSPVKEEIVPVSTVTVETPVEQESKSPTQSAREDISTTETMSKPETSKELSPAKEEIVSVTTTTVESSVKQDLKSPSQTDSTEPSDSLEDVKSKPESEKEQSPGKEEIVSVTTTTVETSVKEEPKSPIQCDTTETSKAIPNADTVEDVNSKPEVVKEASPSKDDNATTAVETSSTQESKSPTQSDSENAVVDVPKEETPEPTSKSESQSDIEKQGSPKQETISETGNVSVETVSPVESQSVEKTSPVIEQVSEEPENQTLVSKTPEAQPSVKSPIETKEDMLLQNQESEKQITKDQIETNDSEKDKINENDVINGNIKSSENIVNESSPKEAVSQIENKEVESDSKKDQSVDEISVESDDNKTQHAQDKTGTTSNKDVQSQSGPQIDNEIKSVEKEEVSKELCQSGMTQSSTQENGNNKETQLVLEKSDKTDHLSTQGSEILDKSKEDELIIKKESKVESTDVTNEISKSSIQSKVVSLSEYMDQKEDSEKSSNETKEKIETRQTDVVEAKETSKSPQDGKNTTESEIKKSIQAETNAGDSKNTEKVDTLTEKDTKSRSPSPGITEPGDKERADDGIGSKIDKSELSLANETKITEESKDIVETDVKGESKTETEITLKDSITELTSVTSATKIESKIVSLSEYTKEVTESKKTESRSEQISMSETTDTKREAIEKTEDKILESVVQSKIIEKSPSDTARIEMSPTKELPESFPDPKPVEQKEASPTDSNKPEASKTEKPPVLDNLPESQSSEPIEDDKTPEDNEAKAEANTTKLADPLIEVKEKSADRSKIEETQKTSNTVDVQPVELTQSSETFVEGTPDKTDSEVINKSDSDTDDQIIVEKFANKEQDIMTQSFIAENGLLTNGDIKDHDVKAETNDDVKSSPNTDQQQTKDKQPEDTMAKEAPAEQSTTKETVLQEKIESLLLNGQDSQVSMKMMRGEVSAKTTYQRTSTGPIAICEVNPEGKYITLENTSSGPNKKDVNLDSWRLARVVDGNRHYTYKFRNFTLKAGKKVKIMARGSASEAGMNDLVFRDENDWGIGQQVTTCLINEKDEEKASHIQKTNYN